MNDPTKDPLYEEFSLCMREILSKHVKALQDSDMRMSPAVDNFIHSYRMFAQASKETGRAFWNEMFHNWANSLGNCDMLFESPLTYPPYNIHINLARAKIMAISSPNTREWFSRLNVVLLRIFASNTMNVVLREEAENTIRAFVKPAVDPEMIRKQALELAQAGSEAMGAGDEGREMIEKVANMDSFTTLMQAVTTRNFGPDGPLGLIKNFMKEPYVREMMQKGMEEAGEGEEGEAGEVDFEKALEKVSSTMEGRVKDMMGGNLGGIPKDLLPPGEPLFDGESITVPRSAPSDHSEEE